MLLFTCTKTDIESDKLLSVGIDAADAHEHRDERISEPFLRVKATAWSWRRRLLI
jgi:hypothetical protein